MYIIIVHLYIYIYIYSTQLMHNSCIHNLNCFDRYVIMIGYIMCDLLFLCSSMKRRKLLSVQLGRVIPRRYSMWNDPLTSMMVRCLDMAYVFVLLGWTSLARRQRPLPRSFGRDTVVAHKGLESHRPNRPSELLRSWRPPQWWAGSRNRQWLLLPSIATRDEDAVAMLVF